jgi:S1-C subfamily serine protease
MSHLIRGFAAAATIAIIATSGWTSSPRAESITGPGSWMGVKVVTLSEGWREQYSYSGAGVRVTKVEALSEADRIGIVAGDILVAVGSKSLRYEDDLATAHSRIDPSQPVPVIIARNNGSLLTIKNLDPIPVPRVEPAAAPAPNASSGVALAAVGAAATATDAAIAEPNRNSLATFGVQCANLNRDLASALGVSKEEGVLVLQVVSGGNADRVGFRAGDVISAAGNQAVASVEALARALSAAPSGITLHTVRRSDERDVTVLLVATPATPTETATATSVQQEAMQQELRNLRQEIEALRAQMAAAAKNGH